jgi:hypothetical protein
MLEEVREYLQNALANGYHHVVTDDPYEVAYDILAYTNTYLTVEQIVQAIITLRSESTQ